MNKTATMGILSVLLIAGLGIASASIGGMGKAQADKPYLGFEEMDAMHQALLAGDYEQYIALAEEYGLTRLSKVTEEKFLVISEKAQQKDVIKQAILAGDWETYSALRDEYGLEGPIHSAMTEEAFSTFSELANLREQQKELRRQLAEELGLEEQAVKQKGKNIGKHIAKRMGYGKGKEGFGQGMGA